MKMEEWGYALLDNIRNKNAKLVRLILDGHSFPCVIHKDWTQGVLRKEFKDTCDLGGAPSYLHDHIDSGEVEEVQNLSQIVDNKLFTRAEELECLPYVFEPFDDLNNFIDLSVEEYYNLIYGNYFDELVVKFKLVKPSFNYFGYNWIKVKKYEMDEVTAWEERYKQLDQHHREETNFLIKEVRILAGILRGRG